MRKVMATLVLLLGLVIAGLLGLRVYQTSLAPSLGSLNTPYKAVQMIGGQVLYGQFDNTYSQYPVLHDIYVVRRTEDPKTQQVSSSLVGLGKERIVLNAAHIVMIQPVLPDSPVGRILDQGAH